MTFCPRVISFYTKDTPYEKEAEGLAKSCDALGIRYFIEGINLDNDQTTNTLFKPIFIKEKINQLNEPLLWVDSDG